MRREVVVIDVEPARVVEVEVPGRRGPGGPVGPPGDQNVTVLQRAEPIPSDTPNYQIIYRLLEDL